MKCFTLHGFIYACPKYHRKPLISDSENVQFTVAKHPGYEEKQSLCSPSPQLQ